jgi:hypothetical protein
MQGLLAALPGIREIRAPLISGYTWLLLVWVLVRPDVDRRPSDEVLAALYDLIHALGPVATTAAISVLAYLLGGAVQGLWLAMLRRLRGPPVEELAQAAEPQIQMRVTSTLQAQQDRWQELTWEPSPEAQAEFDQLVADSQTKLETSAATTRATVQRSFEVPTHLLTSADQHAMLLLAAVDQKKAESELRCTVALPLFVLSIVLSLTVSPIFLVGAVAAIILLGQGLARESEWQVELREAMHLNRMTIIGISDLDQAGSEIAQETDRWYRRHAPQR